jgi:CheY-like chemotaxis protein
LIEHEGRLSELLLVEDNPADVRLTREALKEAKLHHCLHVSHDGVDAMAFLRRRDSHRYAARPDLVLLDLNLPRMNGFEVLAEAKGDPALRRIPIIVLTTSCAERDILQSYELHANGYITKPVDIEAYVTVLRSLHDFWFRTATLPAPR